MNAALIGSVLAASVAGSLHCAGMCGGFVAFYSAGVAGRRSWPGHLAYNGGRLLTYAALGAAAGLFGAGVDRAGALVGARNVAAVMAGVLMVGWGAYALLQALDVALPRPPLPARLARAISRAYAVLEGRPPVVRALLLGLLSTLLPCGWLWAFAVLAAGTGSALWGVAVMVAFWAGTVPVMLGFGVSVQALSAPLRRRLPALTAAMMIVVGLLWLAGRTSLPGHGDHHGSMLPASLAAPVSSDAADEPSGHDHDAP